MFSTLGIPTRSCERSLARGAAECFFANQVCNIGIGMFCLFYSGLDDLHLIQILDQPLRAGVIDDHALPPLGKRDFAPLASGPADQLHVNKTALTIYWAPVTDGVDRGDCLIGQLLNCLEPAKCAPTTSF